MDINGLTKQRNAEGVEAVCLSTAGINALLPCVIKADTILSLGFKPWAQVRAGYWWNVKDVDGILSRVQAQLEIVKGYL